MFISLSFSAVALSSCSFVTSFPPGFNLNFVYFIYLKLGFVIGPDAFSRITLSLWLEFFVGFGFVGLWYFFSFLELAICLFHFLYLDLTGWRVSFKLMSFLFIHLKSFSIGWISIFGALVWLLFLASFLSFILFPHLKWKTALANFCSIVVTVCWLSHLGSAMDGSQMCERFYGMNSTTRTLQLGKEVAKFRVLLEFHKIKSDLQKMSREQFFIVLSTGKTGGHQAELWDGTFWGCKWRQEPSVSSCCNLLSFLCFLTPCISRLLL